MHPWPPKTVRNRQRDGGRRHCYHENRGGDYRDRRGHHDRERRRSRSPRPSNYHNRTPPPPYHQQSPPPPSHHHTMPPHPHNQYHLSPSREHPPTQPFLSSSLEPHPYQGNVHQSIPDKGIPPPPEVPMLEAPPTPTECASTEESNPFTKTESETDKKGFDIEVLGSFGDDEPKAPPTKSDVTDILNMAHGGHTKNSLKPKTTSLTGKHRRGEKHMKQSKKQFETNQPSSSSNLQITHGHSVNVSPTALLVNPTASEQKHSIIAYSSENSDSDIDIMTHDVNIIRPSTVKYNTTKLGTGYTSNEPGGVNIGSSVVASSNRKSAFSVLNESLSMTGSINTTPGIVPSIATNVNVIQNEPDDSFVVRIQRCFTSEGNSSNELAVTTTAPGNTLSSQAEQVDGGHDKKKKKKRKKKRMRDEDLVSTVFDDGAQVRIKLKLHK
ncbi:uncharacterized protein LOC135341310 isoform X3 [Halichondria panicea]